MAGSRVLGVVSGSADAPRVAYLAEPVAVSPGLLGMAGSMPPTEVFRFSAYCEENKCTHFDGRDCQLATRIVQILPAVVDTLPACLIRAECRWYLQEGRPACFRCPQVVTQDAAPGDDMRTAATPASMAR